MVILLHFHFFFFRSQKTVVKNSLVRVLMWKLVHSNFNPVIYFLEDAVTHYWPTPCLMNWYMWSRWPRLGWSGNSHWIVSRFSQHATVYVSATTSFTKEIPKLGFLTGVWETKWDVGKIRTFFSVIFIAWTWFIWNFVNLICYCVNASRLQSSKRDGLFEIMAPKCVST